LGFERARADAERQVRAGLSFADADSVGGQQDDPLPDQGAPLYGQGSFGASSPGLRLQAAELAQARRNLAVSLVLLCVLLVVGVLSYLPQVLRRVQRFWPEQLALLAALLWLMAGPLTVIAMLLCMAIVGRIVELGVLTYCYVRRRETQLPVAAGTSAS
jgi:hypothetical protein